MTDVTTLRQLRMVNTVLLCVGVVFAFELYLTTAAASLGLTGHWPSHQRDLVLVDRTGQPSWQEASRWAVERWSEAGADVRLRWESGPGTGACERDGERIGVCLATTDQLATQVVTGVQGLVDPSIDAAGHTEGSTLLVCSDCRLDAARRRVIVAHELGHALGLSHSDRRSSVMYHTGGSASPDAVDAAEVRAIYAHRDAPLRCGVLNVRVGGICL